MIRVATALLCALVGVYWLAVGSAGPNVGGAGFRLLLAIFTGIWLIAALLPTTVGAAQTRAFLTAAALGLAVYAAVGPLLLAAWTRTDYVRFVWIVSQGAPCSSMGGGPGMLWVLGTSWLVALAATAHAVTSGLTVRRATAGLGLGLAFIGATVLAMVPAPALLAFALGCVL